MKPTKRTYPRQQIENLSQQLHSLKLHVQDLETQQTTLAVQYSVLACCCDILHCLRTGAMHKDWTSYRDSWLPEELPLLLDVGCCGAAGDLLHNSKHQDPQQEQHPPVCRQQQHPPLTPLTYEQELQQRWLHHDSTCSNSSTTSSEQLFGVFDASKAAAFSPCAANGTNAATTATATAAAPHEARFLSPPNNPLAPFEYSLQHPPFPGAASMSLEQLVVYYSAFVKDLALNLNLLDQQQERGEDLCSGSEPPLPTLQRLMQQHACCITTILLLHPDDLLHKFRIVNLHTMEMSDNPEQAWKRTCWIVDKLSFTDQQQHALVAGGNLFKRLLDTLRAERQLLSAQQGEQAQERLPTGRAVDLQGQQDSASRLQLLVKKERFLLTCASAYVCSVLDVVQVARCSVLTWPWTPHFGMLAAVLAARQAANPPSKPLQQSQDTAEPRL